jgi:uncharacterized protein with FMN-binding domain
MRRLLLALVSTAAGLAAVLSFKTQGSAATSGAAAAPQTGTQASSSAPASTGSASSGSGGTASGSGTAAPGSGTAAPGSGGSTSAGTRSGTAGSAGSAGAAGGRTLTGTVASTPYGPMQVAVTMAGKKITGVKVLQETNTGALSEQIDANAVPQLTKETLAAQSARIDAVSGASYTSSGYIKSLQSALDQA